MVVTGLDLALNELIKIISYKSCEEIDNKLTGQPRSVFGMREIALSDGVVASKLHDFFDAQTLVVRAVPTSGLISLEV